MKTCVVFIIRFYNWAAIFGSERLHRRREHGSTKRTGSTAADKHTGTQVHWHCRRRESATSGWGYFARRMDLIKSPPRAMTEVRQTISAHRMADRGTVRKTSPPTSTMNHWPKPMSSSTM